MTALSERVPHIDETGSGFPFIDAQRELAPGERLKLLVPETRLALRIRSLAGDIVQDYGQRDPEDVVFMPVYNGAGYFWDEVARFLPQGFQRRMLRSRAKSRYGAQSTGEVKFLEFPDEADLARKHILIVEGVIDSQLTLAAYVERLAWINAASVHVAALVDKVQAERVARLPDGFVRYLGYTMGNPFVVGAGMDHNDRFRTLPYIAELVMPPVSEAVAD